MNDRRETIPGYTEGHKKREKFIKESSEVKFYDLMS